MSALSIGLSGLLVNQRLITLTGQNIANADTPNYHRQIGELASVVAGTSTGMGVELKNVTRAVDRLLEEAVVRNTVASAGAARTLDGLSQLQSFLAPGEGSLYDSLQRFFNEAEKLSAAPDDLTQRRIVLSAARSLTDRLNATVDGLQRMGDELITEAKTDVSRVNALTDQIAKLNQRIHDGAAVGLPVNDLLDQRDRSVAQLAELVDVRTIPQEFGQINLFAAGTPLVLNSHAIAIESSINDQGKLNVHLPGSSQTVDIMGGKLGSVMTLFNSILPEVQTRFDTFASALVTRVDHIQARGLGLDGPLTQLGSQRTVSNTSLPLSAAKLPYPPQAGELSITITDLTTGQRSLHRLAIDPATQSLTDVAGAISTIPNLQAVVDPQAGTMNLLARPGFGFDFTGNFSTVPDAQSITGTATPMFAGRYTGNGNDTLNFRFVGSGTIGATPNLALEVRNGAGALLTSLNIGHGYEAGTNLADVFGVNVKLTSGSVNNGDTFSLNVTADPDSAHFLPALGLNSFFVGDGASGLRVRPDLLQNPERFALSVSGQPGDGSNLAQLIALRDLPILNGKSQSFRQYLEGMIGDVGSQVQDAQVQQSAYESLGQQLEAQRQSVSGVDPNEELMKLVQYQRGYQMSAHYISAVNETLDDLFRLI